MAQEVNECSFIWELVVNNLKIAKRRDSNENFIHFCYKTLDAFAISKFCILCFTLMCVVDCLVSNESFICTNDLVHVSVHHHFNECGNVLWKKTRAPLFIHRKIWITAKLFNFIFSSFENAHTHPSRRLCDVYQSLTATNAFDADVLHLALTWLTATHTHTHTYRQTHTLTNHCHSASNANIPIKSDKHLFPHASWPLYNTNRFEITGHVFTFSTHNRCRCVCMKFFNIFFFCVHGMRRHS